MKNPLSRNSSGGFLGDTLIKLRLTFELIKDRRVSVWVKLIPVISLIYLISPFDLLVGPIDDAVVLYVAMDFFIGLCPREVASEHLARIQGKPAQPIKEEDIIDVEFKEK